jgi:hypothetical protein
MSIKPTPVTTPHQVEAMRLIFNECLEFMTKPIAPITKERQAQWWETLPQKVRRFKAFTYEGDRDFGIIAYSLLQWHEDGRITPLFGITKSARGRNIAREIIRHYLAEADGPLHGEELVRHAAIVKLNEEAGWQLRYERGGVRYLYHPNEKREYPDYQGMIEYWSGA